MKYKCITPWARNKKGDIIEHWELKRYPPEIHSHFEKIEDAPAPAPVTNKPVQESPKSAAKSEPVLDTDLSAIIKKPKIQFGDEN